MENTISALSLKSASAEGQTVSGMTDAAGWPHMRALHPCAYQAKVVGELLLILNNVSEAALIAKCYVEVRKPLRNLCGTEAQENLAATSEGIMAAKGKLPLTEPTLD